MPHRTRQAWSFLLCFFTVLWLWLQSGVGSAQTVFFAPAMNLAVGDLPRSVAVGDFNGDGKLDLAVANGGSNSVSILLADRTGSFDPATNFAVGNWPESLAVGDFNGDGKLDLAVAKQCSNNVSVLLNGPTPSQMLSNLMHSVTNMNLIHGIANSLFAKLRSVEAKLAENKVNDLSTACNQLNAFTNTVRAQSDKALTEAQGSRLISAANEIKGTLECQ